MSLVDAQSTYQHIGASDERLVEHVRAATPTEPVDPTWRPFDYSLDEVEEHVSGINYGKTYHDNRTAYYYWLSTSA